jgi:hypothetical protein
MIFIFTLHGLRIFQMRPVTKTSCFRKPGAQLRIIHIFRSPQEFLLLGLDIGNAKIGQMTRKDTWLAAAAV